MRSPNCTFITTVIASLLPLRLCGSLKKRSPNLHCAIASYILPWRFFKKAIALPKPHQAIALVI
ncbi:MAG: hypothetical protein KME40_06645 [Komarekiella atlantica HA4396-MV6]|nr:hypothetical protein [Komarekiella atlantica HA4396-MV6]